MKHVIFENAGNPSSYDLQYFYGVNRTPAINDYQVSDMKNFDCESFPHLATRRGRSVFYNDEPLALLCHDTDVYDDYKATGITDNGGFVYRGERLLDGGLSGNNFITEYGGDYVLFPWQKVVSVASGPDGSRRASVSGFNEFEGDFENVHFLSNYSSSSVTYRYGLTLTGNEMSCSCYSTNDGLYAPTSSFMQFFFNSAYPGMNFKLKLYLRRGQAASFTSEECELPEDVYMVIDSMSCEYNGKIYNYGDEGFGYYSASNYFGTGVKTKLKFTARKVVTGEVYDISPHFRHYYNGSLVSDGKFCAGIGGGVNFNSSSFAVLWNDVDILQCHNPMLLGAGYGGRLFGCDNLGVSVYYSSASDKYDFSVSESPGGAGYVLCSDPGKWTAICPYNDMLYVFKRNGMYRIYSSDGLNFYIERIADMGALNSQAVCVVDNIMYFLSENGLCCFSGAYPELLPNSLNKMYLRGILGGAEGKMFASLVYAENGEEKTELCVYHVTKGIFSVHDDFYAEDFVYAGGDVYALSSGTVYKLERERESVPFELVTKNYFFSFAKKAVNGVRVYYDFSGNEGESFTVSVSYNGGEFEPCFKPVTSSKVKYIPVKLKKCDEVRLKISGKGIFSLKALSFTLYQGGDIRQG